MTRIARVQFSDPSGVFHNKNALGHGLKTYDYYTNLDLSIHDLVVVESPSSGFVIVRVEEVIESETVKAAKWIVDRVDLEAHNGRIARAAKAEEIKAILDKKMKKVTELQQYEVLKTLDPDAAKLLEELKELSK